MEQSSTCTGENGRVPLRDPPSEAPTIPVATASADSGAQHPRTMTQVVTSLVTRVSSSCNSRNRRESPYSCRCLQRRRVLLKRWSRRHRSTTDERRPPAPPDAGDLAFPVMGRLDRHELLLDKEFLHGDIRHSGVEGKEVGKVRKHFETTEFHRSHTRSYNVAAACNESVVSRLCCAALVDDVNTDGGDTVSSRRQLGSCSSNSDSTEGGISHTRVGVPAKLGGRLDLDASCFALPRLMSTPLQALARLVGRTRRRRHRSPPRRRSSHEGCEPLTLWAPGRSSSTRLASFHRWLLVLLVCVMVFPTNGSAAPGFPWQTSINEAQAEPGYKYSYYEVLPPKAVYESVIICLLAVSAFIGLIVWVLKSNFEERQQKRMRREASLRERTSSVACLKT